MTQERDKFIRDTLSGYLVPFLVTLISVMVPVIWHSNTAKQDDIMVEIKELRLEAKSINTQLGQHTTIFAVNSGRITALEKIQQEQKDWNVRQEAIDNTFIASIAEMKYKIR